jgi:hypothetical protein
LKEKIEMLNRMTLFLVEATCSLGIGVGLWMIAHFVEMAAPMQAACVSAVVLVSGALGKGME